MGAILDFQKFKILTADRVQKVCASPCRILWRSAKPFPRYAARHRNATQATHHAQCETDIDCVMQRRYKHVK